MKNNLNACRLILLILLCIGWAGATTLRAQDAREVPEHEIKARAEIQRLAGSSKVEDRSEAVARLIALYMDYRLLWTLMNDTDPGVRVMAIGSLTPLTCTTGIDQPLSAELAQKMATMLEKEVTPARISAAFASGHVKEYEAGLVLTSARTLNHLHRHYPLGRSPADYALWQDGVLKPLLLALHERRGETSDGVDSFVYGLVNAFSTPATLKEVLSVTMQRLDDPALPPQRLLRTVEVLWSHPLLGRGRPLHLLLLTQLAPRLAALKPRTLGPMKDGLEKEQAARLFNEIVEVMQTAREELAPAPQPARTAEK